jgi:PHD/YefM family antitoxin component YafN of YafNO toxin-antitoxin module
MKYTLEVPDQDVAFVVELLRRVTSVKLTPATGKKTAVDTTEYLMSTRTNRERLLAAMEEVERGETAVREWPQQ